jgi:hypothetical protein
LRDYNRLWRLQNLKRLQQIVRDQLVKRVSDRPNDVLMTLDRGEEHDRGDGTFRFLARAEPVGFGVAGARAKGRKAAIRFYCSGIFSAQIDSPRQGIAGEVNDNDDRALLAAADSTLGKEAD